MNNITIKEYFARSGSNFNNDDAKIIGPELASLGERGGVTARDVVDAAHSKNSPLHNYFEWNDQKAADLYRLKFARDMMGAIRVKVIEGSESYETRAFQVITKKAYEHEARRYRSFEVLHGDTAFAVQQMDKAYRDLIRWRQEYEPYAQMWDNFGDTFQVVVNQISEFSDETRAQPAAEQMDDALVQILNWRDEFAAALETWIKFHENIGYVFDAIADAEKTFTESVQRMERKCLRCGKDFMSAHAGNRVCQSCFHTFDRDSSGQDETVVSLGAS